MTTFETIGSWDPPRDRWGRPKINVDGKDVPFTRASTLANAIENSFNLEQWKMRQTAIGLAGRDDLIAKVLAKPDDRRVMTEVVDSAMEAAQSSRGANIGTALHGFTEIVDQGHELPAGVTSELRKHLDVYAQLAKSWTTLAMENFVACRELLAAGTFDRLVRYRGRVYVADIKTGKDAPTYSHAASVQMAVYANGQPYGPDGWGEWLAPPSKRWALMIHLPQDRYEAGLYRIDIKTGWEFAKTAVKVRDWWKTQPATLIDVVKGD